MPNEHYDVDKKSQTQSGRILHLSDGTTVRSMEELNAKIEEEDGPDMLFLVQKLVDLSKYIPTSDVFDTFPNDFAAAFENEAVKCGADKLTVEEVMTGGLFKEIGLKAIETIKADPKYQTALEAINADIKAQKTIPRLLSVVPTKHVMPNNKLANSMTRDIVDVGKIILEVSKKGAKQLVETTCILAYEGENVKLSGRRTFTEYDRNVYNAVTSLYVYGDQRHYITPAMVYRAMVGLTDNEKPTPQQIAAVTESLDKMRFIRARINCTQELKMRRATLNGYPISKGEIDTYLLTAETIKLMAGGNEVNGYHIIKTPILYEYAAAVGQVLTVPIEMLDIKKLDKNGKPLTHSLEYTEQRVLIKGYLIRRIEGMKGKNNLKNFNITFFDYEKDGETHKGLYSIAGADNPKKDDTRYIRNDAEAMLAYWKAVGNIKGYTPYKKGRSMAGYTIEI